MVKIWQIFSRSSISPNFSGAKFKVSLHTVVHTHTHTFYCTYTYIQAILSHTYVYVRTYIQWHHISTLKSAMQCNAWSRHTCAYVYKCICMYIYICICLYCKHQKFHNLLNVIIPYDMCWERFPTIYWHLATQLNAL